MKGIAYVDSVATTNLIFSKIFNFDGLLHVGIDLM